MCFCCYWLIDADRANAAVQSHDYLCTSLALTAATPAQMSGRDSVSVAALLLCLCTPGGHTTSAPRLHLLGRYTSDHGYLAVRLPAADAQPVPVCEINRFAATLACDALYPGEDRTLTWFGFAHNTSYVQQLDTCYVIKCSASDESMESCVFSEIASRRQVAYVKCLTRYDNSYCQLEDILVVDKCRFLGVTVIPYWDVSRVVMYSLAAAGTLLSLLAVGLGSKYQNPVWDQAEEDAAG